MTIRRGEAWGTLGPPPADRVLADDDAAVAEIVTGARRSGRPIPPVAVRGGDLWRAIGGSPSAGAGERDEVPLLPVDIVRIEADGATAWFVAHAVARRSWWRGEILAAVNAQYVGAWDVAPRAHPNDGRVDLVRVAPTMSARDRWRARGRLPQGTHVPHPAIDVRQVAATTVDLAGPMWIDVDGRRWRRAARIELTVEPDAFIVTLG